MLTGADSVLKISLWRSVHNPMLADFHEIILSNGKPYDFRFLKMNSIFEEKYFISVVKDLTFYRFRMIFINRAWRIGDQTEVPEWILNLEKVLSTTISMKMAEVR